MTAYSEAVGKVRSARLALDAARDHLYKLQLERLAISRARQRAARGDGVAGPAAERSLGQLRAAAAKRAVIEGLVVWKVHASSLPPASRPPRKRSCAGGR